MADIQLRTFKVETLPTSGYVVGGIYFIDSENKIYVRTETGWDVYDHASEATHAAKADSATSATKADTASKVTNKLTVGSKTYDGSTAVSLTKADFGLGNVDNTADSAKKIYETQLKWSSTNLNGEVSPIDVSIISELGTNRLGFFEPDHMSIEYSNDGGETWIDYAVDNVWKLRLVTQDLSNSSFVCGKASAGNMNVLNRLKISFFDFNTCSVPLYCTFRKFAIYLGTNGANDCWVTVRKNTQANQDVFEEVVTKQPISGWSGWNILNIHNKRITVFGGADTGQTQKIEFIFGYDSISELTNYNGLSIYKIYGFAETLYSGTLYQKIGVPYEVTFNRDVKFPAIVSATQIRTSGAITSEAYIYAKQDIYENGTVLSQRYVQQVSGKQLSTNDYTTEEKTKLAGLSNAEALTNSEIDEAIK